MNHSACLDKRPAPRIPHVIPALNRASIPHLPRTLPAYDTLMQSLLTSATTLTPTFRRSLVQLENASHQQIMGQLTALCGKEALQGWTDPESHHPIVVENPDSISVCAAEYDHTKSPVGLGFNGTKWTTMDLVLRYGANGQNDIRFRLSSFSAATQNGSLLAFLYAHSRADQGYDGQSYRELNLQAHRLEQYIEFIGKIALARRMPSPN